MENTYVICEVTSWGNVFVSAHDGYEAAQSAITDLHGEKGVFYIEKLRTK